MLKVVFYIGLLAVFLNFHSCQTRTDVELTNVIGEWINKEIKFDNGYIFTSLGKDSVLRKIPQSKYKILVYTDSVGCIGCNLRLLQWKDWMKQIDSISDNKVSFLFFIRTPKIRNKNETERRIEKEGCK